VYNITGELGQGEYGTVHLAEHKTTNQQVAIKRIAKNRIKQAGRLESELQVIRQCDHPNIVRCYEIWEDDRHASLVLELCSGGELYDWIVK
jgi:serine/threonine protein kinase